MRLLTLKVRRSTTQQQQLVSLDQPLLLITRKNLLVAVFRKVIINFKFQREYCAQLKKYKEIKVKEAMEDNEDNILKAFEIGAHDVMNQKRDPNDFIVFDNPNPSQTKTQNPSQGKYGDAKKENTNVQEKIVIGFDEEDDDDFTGNQHQYNHQTKTTQSSYAANSKNSAQNTDQIQGGYNDQEEDDQDNKNRDNFEVNNNNNFDNQMFINRNELNGGNQASQGQVASRPAGIYLAKDDDLEKLKELYEGQEREKVEATNKQFALNRQAQEKKKKQQQDQKKKVENANSNNTNNNNNNNGNNIAKLTNNDFKFDKSNKLKNIINDEEELGEIGEWIEKTANVNKKKKDDGFDDDDEDDDQKSNKDDDDDFNFDDIPQKQNNQAHKETKKNTKIIQEEDDSEDEPNWNAQKNNQKVNDIISQEVHQQKKKEEQEMLKEKQGLISKKLQQDKILKQKSGTIANRLQDKAKFMQLTNTKSNDDKNTQPEKEQQGTPLAQNSERNTNRLNEEEEENDEDGIDWEKVNQNALKEHGINVTKNNQQGNKEISFIDAWSDFKGQNLQELKKQIVTTNNEKKQFSFFEYLNSFCGVVNPNISSPELLSERDIIFAIAKMQYDDNAPLHFQMLYSVFSTLTNNTNCPRIGSHWEQIGFQGKHPGTDLRGAGMLGLLQILAFVSHYKDFMIDVLQYSHDPIHNFPLSITLINVTDIVLQTCREQKLNSLINKEKSVISVFNNFYFATFYFLFTQYKSKQYTVNRFDELKKSVELAVKQNPKKTLEDFKLAIQQYYKRRE